MGLCAHTHLNLLYHILQVVPILLSLGRPVSAVFGTRTSKLGGHVRSPLPAHMEMVGGYHTGQAGFCPGIPASPHSSR